MVKSRNYEKEYRDFHSKPEQIKRRAERNKARRDSGLRKGDSREVHHQNAPRTGTLKNTRTRVVSKKTNRSIQPKRGG